MKKVIIHWNTGYGASYEVVEVEEDQEAEDLAYENWREEAESNAEYGIMEWSEENEEDYL